MSNPDQTVIVLSFLDGDIYGIYADVAAMREYACAPEIIELVLAGAHSGQAAGFNFRVKRVRSADTK